MGLGEDLDLLGAEGLSGQFITLRVRSIDKLKLGQALGGGSKAAVLPAALAMVDFAPQQTLDLLMPIVQEKVKTGYGVDLDYQISEAAPKAGETPKASGGKLVLLGLALGAAGTFAASRFGAFDAARSAGQHLLHKVGL